MNNYESQDGYDRQHIRRRQRVKLRLQRRPVFLACICFTVLICVLTSQLNGMLPSAGNSQPFSMSAESGSELASSTPQKESSLNTADETDWSLILVNKWNTIPADYSVELTQLKNGQSVDCRIYTSLQEMFDAARGDGIYPIVAAGYRTTEKQQSLMDEKIAELEASGYAPADAQTETERWVAIPGTSEHQLGLAVDINADGIRSSGYEVYEWLAENAYRYGFILRYPENKEDITGTAYEAWHYRYVGVEAATEIFENKLCLEEYLESQN